MPTPFWVYVNTNNGKESEILSKQNSFIRAQVGCQPLKSTKGSLLRFHFTS